MKIKDTELEYTEADAIVLDYWLGEDETKEQWAQRVCKLCKEYAETDGLGHDGQGMPDAYARTPQDLWENKKRRRRIQFVNMLDNKKINMESDINCPELADNVIMGLKNHQNYKTRQAQIDEERTKKEAGRQKAAEDRSRRLDFYIAQGRSDEDIILTHPDLKPIIEMRKQL